MLTSVILFTYIFICSIHSIKSNTLSNCNQVKDCLSSIEDKSNQKKILGGIKECLLADYTESEYNLIPPHDSNETFSIRYQYSIKELISVEDDIAEVDILMNLFWRDPCLRWIDNQYYHFPYLILSTKDIWRPKVFVPSTIKPISSQDNIQVVVHSNGDCEESLLFRLKIMCEDFPLYFPNDYQICRINFKFKFISNFTLLPFANKNLENNCITNNLELGEWFIECKEFNNTEGVISTNQHWPFLSSVDSTRIYLGTINGSFTLKRYPQYTYSSVMLPSLIVCVNSQLILIMRPYAQNYAVILSSVFLSLSVLVRNLPNFNKFSLLSLILNWIFCLCASNVIIIILSNTISRRKKACLPLLQCFYRQICMFNQTPTSLILILSLSIILPIFWALLLQRIIGFILGTFYMVIIWITIASYMIRAGFSLIRLKSKSVEKENISTNPKSQLSNAKDKDKDEKSQITKLVEKINQLTVAIKKTLVESQLSTDESRLKCNMEPNDLQAEFSPLSKLVIKQEEKHVETKSESDPRPMDEGKTASTQKKENSKDPNFISEWNGKLAEFLCRIWTCVHIIGNIFLNVTLLIIYYRFWKTF